MGSTEESRPDSELDGLISDIRNEAIDPAEERGAAERVWARISEGAATAPANVERIRTCADFQGLIPDWRAGRLSEARALLLTDHAHECAACRKAMAGVKEIRMAPRRAPVPVWKWAVAAAVIAGAGMTGFFALERFGPAPDGPRATVAAVDGTLYDVHGGPLASGASLVEAQPVRTAKLSRAVLRLRDGSLVEMRERTELSLSERRDGVTVRLAGGSIIVQAAKQGFSKHLRVSTGDATVAVRGTVFSVNHGIKGSRVAVLEGAVQVDRGANTTMLYPGQQLATSESISPVPLEQEFNWSRDAGKYIALMAELTRLRKNIEALPGPGLHYATDLLNLAPPGAIFYASIPNLGQTVSEANRLFHEQLAQSAVLEEWWNSRMKSPAQQVLFDELLRQVTVLSGYLGPEMVIAFDPGAPGIQKESPVLLARIVKPGFRAYLQAQLNVLAAASPEGAKVRIVDDPLHAAPSADHELLVFADDNLLAVSGQLAPLQKAAARVGGLGATPFGGRIAQAYQGGVSWLFAVDLESAIKASPKSAGEAAHIDQSGFGDMRYFIAERKDVSGKAENVATLSFSQPRRGIASWLAAPAANPALNYVSADASLAVAGVAKNPAQMLDDLSAIAGADRFAQGLADFQAKTGVDMRADLAQLLGGEFAFALDGPMLPMPSWKVVLEVNDPVHFQQTVAKLVETANQEAAKSGSETRLALASGAGEDGRTYYTLSGIKPGIYVVYTFDAHFLIAAPNRDLLARAVQNRGYTLASSPKFQALLPQDGNTNFSAMVYHNLGMVLAPLAGAINLTPDQQKALSTVTSESEPTLVLVYGGENQIQVAARGTLFGLSPERLLGLQAARAVSPARNRLAR
jgi:ferric-dicitrate binding protein FerR (iron transport regulator)